MNSDGNDRSTVYASQLTGKTGTATSVAAAKSTADSLHRPHEAKQNARSIPSLDGLRAISVLMVIIAHARGTAGFPKWGFQQFGDIGNLGVKIFFVISGFLITSILLKEYAKSGTINLRRFYIRRSWRIFPAMYTYMAVIGLLTLAGAIVIPLRHFAYGGLYALNFLSGKHSKQLGHLWSLAVEEQFYLVWPVLLAFFGLRAMRVCWAALLIAPLSRMAIATLWPGTGSWQWFPAVADGLAAGCLLTGYRDRIWAMGWYRAIVSSRLFLPSTILGIAVVNRIRHGSPQVGYFLESLLILLITVLIDRVVRFPPALLNWRPVATVGAMSYSLYIWQQLFLNRREALWYTTFPQSGLLVIALAAASYYLVEQPCLRIRDRLEEKPQAPPSTPELAPLAVAELTTVVKPAARAKAAGAG